LPKEKSDVRLVAHESKQGAEPAALRLSKTVRGGDQSIYTLLLPGVVPDPLKLSIHPTGEIQLKTQKAGRVARLNMHDLIERLLSGSLDDILALLLSPRLEREAVEGVLFVAGLPALFAGSPDKPLRDIDLSVDKLTAGLTRIRINDATKLGEAMSRLREDGLLPEQAMLLLAPETSDMQIGFVSLLDRPLDPIPTQVPLPEGFPFPKSMRALFYSLAKYGGILFTMPSESEIQEMARVIGLGDFVTGLTRLEEALNEPGVEHKLGQVAREIVQGFTRPLRKVARAKPLRPLNRPTRNRGGPMPPIGGWVRRRPRRRGHTAPLRHPVS
jgi:hypothetical protein